MIKKHMDKVTYTFTGSMLLIFGILLIWKKATILAFFLWMIGVIALLQGLSLFIKKWLQHNFHNADTLRILCDGILAFLCILTPKLPMSIFTLLFAGYLAINGMAKGINAYLSWKNHANGVFVDSVASIFYLIFAIVLTLSPYMKVEDVLIWIGIYCIALGLTYIRDILSIDHKYALKRKIRITLPIWMCALIPKRMINQLNHYLQDNGEKASLYDQKEEGNCDMMIYIHATEKGFGMIGHIDFSMDHKVYSYGNYDHESVFMMEALGDGVLFIADEDPYLPFCIQHEENTIFAFGLRLNEEQKQKVHEELASLFTNAIPWKPNIVKDPSKEYPQFSNQLYLATHAEFYKFQQGCFKTYFVLGNNCVRFVDRILGSLGSDILNMRGFVTPGTYLDYLQRVYTKPHSFVISQAIYPCVKKKKKGYKRHVTT